MRVRKTLLATGIAAALGLPSLPAGAAPAAPFPEYYNQWGLAAVNALDVWGVNGTGQGVTVAVLDSGVRATHVDLAGNISPNGYDFYNNDADPNDDTDTGHGTFVAGILAGVKNGLGTVGVAYNATILPIKVEGSDRTLSYTSLPAAIDYAVANGARVLNLSIQARADDNVLAALQRAAAAERVIVMAAGNAGEQGPVCFACYAGNLSGHGIAVGAVNPDLTLASFSNSAGGLAEWYMVAPGVDIYSTTNANDNDFKTNAGGTSWATPHVAGAAATLFSLFPQLTGYQVVDILLKTATDLGAPGTDPVYGRGLLNLQAALAPLPPIGIPTPPDSGGGGGGGAGLGLGLLVIGGAFGLSVMNKSKTLKEAMILDGYDRAYTIDLTGAISSRDHLPPLSSLLGSFGARTRSADILLPNQHQFSVQFVEQADYKLLGEQIIDDLAHDPDPEPQWAMAMNGPLGMGLTYDIALNMNPAHGLGLLGFTRPGASFLTAGAFSAPVLGFTDSADRVAVTYGAGRRTALTVGLVSSEDEQDPYGPRSEAALVDASYHVDERLSLGLQLSQLIEHGSLLGGSSDGPLSVDRAETTALGLSAVYRFGEVVSLIGRYTEGFTRVQDKSNSLLHDFSTLRSNSIALGLMADGLWSRHDQLGIAISQPLRVIDGDATLTVASARDVAGNLRWNSERLGLAPADAELDVEAYYRVRLRPRAELGAYFLYQDSPYHSAELGHAVSAYTTLKLTF